MKLWSFVFVLAAFFVVGLGGVLAVAVTDVTYNLTLTTNNSNNQGMVFIPNRDVYFLAATYGPNTASTTSNLINGSSGLVIATVSINTTTKIANYSATTPRLFGGQKYIIVAQASGVTNFNYNNTAAATAYTGGKGNRTNVYWNSSYECASSFCNGSADTGTVRAVLNIYTDTDTPVTELRIIATSAYDSSNINTFNATITGTGDFVSLLDKSGNGNNLTNNGATYNTTDNSYYFFGTTTTNRLTRTAGFSELSRMNNFTVSMTLNIENGAGVNINSVINSTDLFGMSYSAGTIRAGVYNGTGYSAFRSIPVIYNSTVNVIAVYKDFSMYIYFQGNSTGNGSLTPGLGTTSGFAIGNKTGGSSTPFQGKIYNTLIWNRSLSAAEVATVYANGTVSDGLVAWYDFDDYGTVTLSTTNGTINSGFTANNTQPANITVEATNYFSSSINGFNSSLFSSSLSQAVVGFTASEVITNSSVTDFTVSVPGKSNTSTSPVLYLDAGTYNVTFNKTGWFNITQTVTVSALTSSTVNIDNVYRYVLNITAVREVLLTREYVFSVTARSGNYSYNITLNTTTGNISIPWTNDTNLNITFENSVNLSRTTLLWNTSNYTSLPATVSIQITSLLTNSLYITFRDETTGALITGTTITMYVTGAAISYNYSTTTGYINSTMIYPQNYTIEYGGTGYDSRQFNIELSNQTYQNLVLYLINSTDGTLVLVSVVDTASEKVADATIYLNKKNLSGTNYYTVEMCTTDANGECLLNPVLYTTTYNILVGYEGSTRYESGDTKISQTSLLFVIVRGEEVLDNYFEIANVEATLTTEKLLNDTIANWSATYTNPGLSGQAIMLEINGITQGERTQLYAVNGTGVSGSLSYSQAITTAYDELEARLFYIDAAGNYILLKSSSVITGSFEQRMGSLGLFLFGFFFVGVIAFATITTGLTAFLFSVPAVFTVLQVVGIGALGWSTIGMLWVFTFIIWGVVKK